MKLDRPTPTKSRGPIDARSIQRWGRAPPTRHPAPTRTIWRADGWRTLL